MKKEIRLFNDGKETYIKLIDPESEEIVEIKQIDGMGKTVKIVIPADELSDAIVYLIS